MRTVEFNTEMSGEKGLNCRPFSPDSSSRLDYASVNVLLRHQQKGDISNELTMGTFLTRLDKDTSVPLTCTSIRRNLSAIL